MAKKVLLVCSSTMVDLLRAACQRAHAEVLIAGTLAEAAHMLMQSPDLVVWELMLPDGDARPLIQATRNAKPLLEMVGVSGDTDERLMQFGAGCNRTSGPFHAITLVAEILSS